MFGRDRNMSTGLFSGPELVELLSTYFFVLIKHQLYSGQIMSAALAECYGCYLTQNMTCFKQLGHFVLLRDRMLYHFSKMPQQQQCEMSEDDGNLNL